MVVLAYLQVIALKPALMRALSSLQVLAKLC
jgi:hypothetical protein